MELNILAFGKIADLTAGASWKLEGASSTAELRRLLEMHYPVLQGMRYQIAVNKKVVTSDMPLSHGAEIALLPPFSGG